MSDKNFIRILIIIMILGLILTFAHMTYIYFAFQKSSIIYYISKELWL